MLFDRREQRRVEVPACDIKVVLMPFLVGPRHALVGDPLPKRHVSPFPGGLGEPIPVPLHLSFLLQLLKHTHEHKRILI